MTAEAHRMAHVCLLVQDIDKAIETYRAILGVIDPQQLEKQIVYYGDFGEGEERLKFATFPSAGCEIQFMEPLTPGTPLWNRLEKYGEGVHHVAFTSSDTEDVVRQLRAAGIRVMNDGRLARGTVVGQPAMDWQGWTFINPQDAHGLMIELANNYESVDGNWEPGVGVAAEAPSAH
jgi:methylmalonyl-CoA/ethylmalonyl-CoA epimerase